MDAEHSVDGVNEISGSHGDLVVLPGAGHLLVEGDAPEVLGTRTYDFVARCFAR